MYLLLHLLGFSGSVFFPQVVSVDLGARIIYVFLKESRGCCRYILRCVCN